ncbi:MAG: hypothetical protein BEN18_04380 [Epulopiscium sp. Nuni2H_MBin001]|nr:MAG: hypothetical protein BEN18_04380 [Epulopiscium sp. Nuni2H_MBin001]
MFSVNSRIDKYNDSTFKELSKDDEIIWEILINYVKAHSIDIDEYRLERVEVQFFNHYISFLEKLEADVVYKLINRLTGHIIYLHIEFQSKVDFKMALRIEQYGVNLKNYYLAKNNLEGSGVAKDMVNTPRIISVVVYLGSGEWTAADNLGELTGLSEFPIRDTDSKEEKQLKLKAFRASCKENATAPIYTVVNPSQQQLKQSDGLFSAMMFVVKSNSADEFIDNIIYVINYWGLEEGQRNKFLRYIRPVLKSDEARKIRESVIYYRKEVEKMFVSVDDEIMAKGRAQGKAEGIIEGMAKGEARGEAIGVAVGEARGKVEVYYKEMKLTPQQIAVKLGIDVKEVQQIIKSFK